MNTTNRPVRALIIATVTAVTILTVAADAAHAFSNGAEVMQAAYAQSRQHENQRSSVELLIQNRSGKTRVREFRLWHKIFPGRSKSLIKFDRPPSVKNTGLLSETADGAPISEQWIYLPALRSVKQLNADEQNNSFVGSDFTNGDIAGRTLRASRATAMICIRALKWKCCAKCWCRPASLSTTATAKN